MLKYDERRRELLTLLSDYGELSREILSAICGDTSHGRRTMKRLFDDKVIKESNITSSNKPRYLFHSCYITNRGKQVLMGKANTVE